MKSMAVREGMGEPVISLRKNYLYSFLCELLTIALPLVTSPYIARALGAEGLGIFSYSRSISEYFALFAVLGMKNYGNRMVARLRDDPARRSEAFCNLFCIQCILALLVTVAYLAYGAFLAEDKACAMIQCVHLIGIAFDVSWFFFGMERMRSVVIGTAAAKLLITPCIFLFIEGPADLWRYALIMAIGTLMGLCFLLWRLPRYVRYVRPSASQMASHIGPLLRLFLPVLMVSLYSTADKVMLGAFSAKEQVGFFESAEKVEQIPSRAIQTLQTVMMPRIANLVARGEEEKSAAYVAETMQITLLIACALCFGLLGVAEAFAVVFFGEGFQACGVLIQMLAVTIPLRAVAGTVRTQHMIPRGMDSAYTRSVFAGAILNIAGNALLIPRFSAVGAAVTAIMVETLVCCMQVYSVRKQLPVLRYLRRAWFFAVEGLLMLGIVRLVGRSMGEGVRTLALQIAIGALFYVSLSAIYLYRTNNVYFLQVFRRFRV